MSDSMTPIPFGNLMNWILEEQRRALYLESASPSMQIRRRFTRFSDGSWRRPLDPRQALIPSWPRTLWRLMWQAAGSLN